jgi:hypothetical protein
MFDVWNTTYISQYTVNQFVQWRKQWDIPIWLGEYGAGYVGPPYTTPEWQNCMKITNLLEEQAMGWSLFVGGVNASKPWNYWLWMFPLQSYNPSLIRQPFPTVIEPPNITNFVSDKHSVSKLNERFVELSVNGSYATLEPGIVVYVVKANRVGGSEELASITKTKINITVETTFTHEENTSQYPGTSWLTRIYSIG